MCVAVPGFMAFLSKKLVLLVKETEKTEEVYKNLIKKNN